MYYVYRNPARVCCFRFPYTLFSSCFPQGVYFDSRSLSRGIFSCSPMMTVFFNIIYTFLFIFLFLKRKKNNIFLFFFFPFLTHSWNECVCDVSFLFPFFSPFTFFFHLAPAWVQNSISVLFLLSLETYIDLVPTFFKNYTTVHTCIIYNFL